MAQFAIIPDYLIEASPVALRVYFYLALRADHTTGECWPSRATIAGALHISSRTVSRALWSLIHMGAIEVTHRQTDAGDWDSNLYRLPFTIARQGEVVTPVSPPTDTSVPTGTDTSVQGVLTPVAHKPDPIEPEPVEPHIAARPRNEIWDALVDIFGEPTTDTNRRLRGKISRSLKTAGATYDEIIARARGWPLHFTVELTETALEKHWDRLGRPPLRATPGQARQIANELERQRRRRQIIEGDDP